MEPKWILFLIAGTMLTTLLLYNNVTGSFGVSAAFYWPLW